MRTVLSEQAVARIGRCGCGVLSHVRALQEGVNVARALMVGIAAVGGGRMGDSCGASE